MPYKVKTSLALIESRFSRSVSSFLSTKGISPSIERFLLLAKRLLMFPSKNAESAPPIRRFPFVRRRIFRKLIVACRRAPRPRAKRASTLGVLRRTLVRLTAALLRRLDLGNFIALTAGFDYGFFTPGGHISSRNLSKLCTFKVMEGIESGLVALPVLLGIR